MNVSKGDHVFESILAPIVETAAADETMWVDECPEEHVPNRQVGEVVGVMAELMMDAM
jgi:hypothetical protein